MHFDRRASLENRMSVASASSRSRLPNSSQASSMNTAASTFDDETVTIQRRETYFYPLYSEISTITNIPDFLYGFFRIFNIIQLIAASMATVSHTVWFDGLSSYSFLLDFGIGNKKFADTYPTYIFLTVVWIVDAVWHIIIFALFRFTKQFFKWQLYVTAFCNNILFPCIFPMFASHLARAFIEITTSDENKAESAIFFVLMAIGSIVVLSLSLINLMFSFDSPLLINTLEACWDPILYIGLFIPIFEQVLLYSVADAFENWMTVIVAIINILALLMALYRITTFPFIHLYVNMIFFSLLEICILASIFNAVRSFGIRLPPLVYIVSFIGVYIISFIITVILFKRKANRIIDFLSYSSLEEESINEAQKRAHFDEIQFTSSQVYSVMRIGIQNNCDMFLDFSFAHYVIENFNEKDLLLLTALMLSFFPTELQFFGYCLGQLSKFSRLGMIDHYLLFQLKKVHLMRQSSLSNEAASQIRHVKKQSSDAISAIRSFWKEISSSHGRVDFGSLLATRKTTNKIIGVFQDMAERFSNNQQMCEEYAFFLIEGCGDFAEAIKWRNRAHLLELGRRMNKDYAFRSLMNIFPHYLIDKIVDVHGNFIESNTVNAHSTASQSESITSNSAAMDQKLEEMTKGVISESRLRIAMQNQLQHTKFPGANYLAVSAVFQLIVGIVIHVIILIIIPTVEDQSNVLVNDFKNTADFFVNMQFCSLAVALTTGQIAIPPIKEHVVPYKFEVLRNIGYDYTVPYPSTAVGLLRRDVTENIFGSSLEFLYMTSRQGLQSLDMLMRSVLTNPEARVAVINELIHSNYQYMYFKGAEWDLNLTVNKTNRQSAVDLANQGAMGAIVFTRNLPTQLSPQFMFSTFSEMISSIFNAMTVLTSFEEVKTALAADGNKYVNNLHDSFYIASIALPVLYGLVFLFFQIHALIILYSNTKHCMNILKKVKPEAIEDSLRPISMFAKDKKIINGSAQLLSRKSIAYYMLPGTVILVVIINAIFLFLPFYMGYQNLESTGNLFEWYNLGSTRLGNILETVSIIAMSKVSGYHAMEKIGINYGEFMMATLGLAQNAHNKLLVGTKDIPGLVGFDTSLDNSQFIDLCSSTPDKLYKYYECLSVDRGVDYAFSYIKKTIKDLVAKEEVNISYFLNESVYYSNVLVLLDTSLIRSLENFQTHLLSFARTKFESVTNQMTIISIIGLVVEIVLTFFVLFLMKSFYTAFDAIRQLIRLLPPSSVLKNTALIQFILGTNNDSNKILSPAETLIYSTSNAVISISEDYTINSVNPSFRQVTGQAPNEVLGHPLTILFPRSTENSSSTGILNDVDIETLYEKMDRMKKTQSKDPSVFTMRCTTQSGTNMYVKVTVIPVYTIENKFDCFTLVMRDMIDDIKQEREAKNAKRRSEKILSKIIPPQVYQMIQNHDDNMLFVSNSATVIFIEIVGLIDTVNSLSPTQVITILTKFYDTFEEIATRYPAVHEIKSYDDQLVACCGLFDFTEQPNVQVEQAVSYCLEINSVLDELNEQLVVSLQFRFGINFGGPLYGDVLDSSTPTFDILGEIIAPAIKMSSEGKTGVVQITESVKSLLDTSKFHIEEGGYIEDSSKHQFRVFYVDEL